MPPRADFVKVPVRCKVCNKVIYHTYNLDFLYDHYCDKKKCKKQHMLSKLDG